MMYTPGLVQCRKHITTNHLVTNKTKITKQLVIMGLTIRKPTLLVVPMPKERFLTLGTHKMLNVPMFSQRRHHPFLNWATTSTTNWDPHSIVTLETIQFVHVVGSKSGTTLHLTCRIVQLNTTTGAIEMVPVIDFTTEPQWTIINYAMALVTNILANTNCFHVGVTLMAQGTILVTNESGVGQFFVASFATEAMRMPTGCHRLDDTANDKVAAFVAAWCKEDVKVAFTIFAAFEFIKNAIVEFAEALSAPGSVKQEH